MKDLRVTLLFLGCLFCSSVLLAQGFTYQAVVRNPSNDLTTNSEVQIEISILEGSMSGPVIYQETHNKITNDAGLVTFEIGSVMPASFDAIPWENGDFYLRQRINPDPVGMPGNYTIESTTKLLSVPYAKYAEKAGRAAIADAIAGGGNQGGDFMMPAGSVIPFAGEVAPAGWFICDGRSLDQTQYADLFAVIGNTYGGVGASFNIPDLRGRHPMGKGNAPFADLNNSGGGEEQALTEAQLASHSHGINGVSTNGAGDHSHYVFALNAQGFPSPTNADNPLAGIIEYSTPNIPDSYFLGPTIGNVEANAGRSSVAGNHSHTINGGSTDNTGDNESFSILDPYIVLNYIIKY